MKKVLIVILIWFIVASFFYAAIWTNENNSVSYCWLQTGVVSIGQVMLTGMSYFTVHDIKK